MTKRLPYILCALALMVLIQLPVEGQSEWKSSDRMPYDRSVVPVQPIQYRTQEICHNGIDDDGDGLIDCEDGDCEILMDGGFENIPVAPYPGSSVTFPPYPTFIASWAAVNIDGEVFYSSPSKPAADGMKYASLLQNAGANTRTPWTEDSWNGGGYDRFLFLAQTQPSESYNVSFSHAADNRYNYLGSQTLIQIQSMQTGFYYDTLITTPGLFEWETVLIHFQADANTSSVAILFSSYGPYNSSVVVDELNFCGNSDHEIVAIDDEISTTLDQSVVIPVLSNDEQVPADGVSLSILDQPVHGTLVINPDGTTTYTPYTNFVCADSFQYEVCNTSMTPVSCDAAWAYINIEGQAPYAVDDLDSTKMDNPLNIRVLENDVDFDNALNPSSIDTLSGQGPLHGTLQKNTDGSFTYIPEPGYLGIDQFSYVVCDVSLPVALRDSAIVYVHVTEPPVIISTETFNLTVLEDESIDICASTYFETDDSGVLTVCKDGNYGYLIDGDDGCWSYYPYPDYNGSDEICLISCDGSICDTSIFFIEVLPVNDEPVAEDDRVRTYEDVAVNMEVLLNDSDIDGDILSLDFLTVIDQPNHGNIVNHPVDGLIYYPYPNYTGMDTVSYQICDNGQPSLCDWATVVIQVLPIPDTIFIDMEEDANISLCSDTVLNLTGSMAATTFYVDEGNGFFTPTEPPCFEYVPDSNFNGIDTVWLVVCHLNEPCDTFVYIIDVAPVNDAPVVSNDLAVTEAGNTVSITVISNDNDAADSGNIDETSVLVTEAPYNGTVVVLADGSIEYIPDPGFEGIDSFTYSVCDLGDPAPALCGSAVVYVEVYGNEEISCMIPEAFSPNGDGLYDVFRIPCSEYYPDMDLFIYDRYGNQMYQSSGGYQNDWDGSVLHTGKFLKEGTYYWVVRFNDGYTKDRAGHVLIWR